MRCRQLFAFFRFFFETRSEYDQPYSKELLLTPMMTILYCSHFLASEIYYIFFDIQLIRLIEILLGFHLFLIPIKTY